jgi:hypothetical protein
MRFTTDFICKYETNCEIFEIFERGGGDNDVFGRRPVMH